MRIQASSSLKGSYIAKPFFIGVAICLAVFFAVSFGIINNELSPPVIFFSYFAAYTVLAVYMIFVSFLFTKSVIANLSFGAYRVVFSGKFFRYLAIIISGILFSALTLGIYLPWFVKRLMDFWASETSVGGQPFKFKGTVGKLWKYCFFALILPCIAVSCIVSFFVSSFYLSILYQSEMIGLYTGTDIQFIIDLCFFILCDLFWVPFSCLLLKWKLSLAWQKENGGAEFNSVFEFSLGKMSFYIIGQILMTIFTLGILGPMAGLNIYRYVVSRIVLYRNNSGIPAGRFGTDLTLGEGFGFLWLQYLLCIVTLGLYFPWAYAAIVNFLVERTWLDTGRTPELEYEEPLMLEAGGESGLSDHIYEETVP